MKYLKTIGFFILVFLPLFSYAQTGYGDTLWAKSTTSASNPSYFDSVATDSNGNSYGAGYISGNVSGDAAFDFGNGVIVIGPAVAFVPSMLLVKYDASGNAEWAKSVLSCSNGSFLYDVTTDNNENVYVVGHISGNGNFNIGNGVIVKGSYSSGFNIFVAKYDASGNALWAKSTSAGGASLFNGVAVDTSGNVYAVGYIYGNGAHDFNGIIATGSFAAGFNTILIKYDTNGTIKWAKTVSGSTDASTLYSVALDNTGNPYVAGTITGTSTFNFGNGVSVTGINSYDNILLVKYDSNGNAQWAKTATGSPNNSVVKALALDNDGNIFGGGYVNNAGSYSFGDGVNVTAPYAGKNALLLKYNSVGNAQWAKLPTIAPSESEFSGTAVDNNANIYTSGYIKGTSEYNFGNGVTISGVDSNKNLALVSYDTSGNTLQAKGVVNGTDNSIFYGARIDSTGDFYAGGFINGDDPFDFGNDITVNGSINANNVVIVKYRGNYADSSSHQSDSSSSNTNVTSKAPSLAHKLPTLFAVGGAILLLF